MILLAFSLLTHTATADDEEDKAALEVEADAIIKILETTKATLGEEIEPARLALRMLRFDASNYQNKSLETLFEEASVASSNVNRHLPHAQALLSKQAEQFEVDAARARWGWNKAGYITTYAESLQDSIDYWSKLRKDLAEHHAEECEGWVEQAESQRSEKRDMDQSIAHLVDITLPRMGAIEILYPAPQSVDGASVVLSEEEKALKKRVLNCTDKIEPLAASFTKIQAAAKAKRMAAIAENRFPGGATTDPSIKAALSSEFKDIQRVAAAGGWRVVEERRWVNGGWVFQTVRYMDVWLAGKTPSGTHRVYRTQVRSKKSGGSWGAPTYWGVSGSYLILPENIAK